MSEAPSLDGIVSPELALVDPVLACEARRTLPDRVAEWGLAHGAAPGYRVYRATVPRPELVWAPAWADTGGQTTRHRWRARAIIASAGVLSVAVLLLLDVHVKVGKTPAEAEGPAPAVTTPPPSSHVGSTPRPERPSARRFAWAPAPRASAYRVVLIRGNQRVFEADTRTAEITIPPRWSYRGVRRRLEPGEYRWVVWPIVDGKRAARAVVQSTLVEP